MSNHKALTVYFTPAEIDYVKALKARLSMNGQEFIIKLLDAHEEVDGNIKILDGPLIHLDLVEPHWGMHRISFQIASNTRMRLEQLRLKYYTDNAVSMTQLIRSMIFGICGDRLVKNNLAGEACEDSTG